MAADAHRTIEAVWRIEAPRVIASVMRIVRDLGAAEDLAHDALVAALEQWPASGVPGNPGAWLTAAAKRRAIDAWRRGRMRERKHGEIGHEMAEREATIRDPAWLESGSGSFHDTITSRPLVELAVPVD